MAELYYNVFEAGKVFKLMEVNPLLALEECKKYISKYPKDYSIYTYYIEILLILGRLSEAEKSLKRLEKVVSNDEDYNKHADRVYLLNCSLAYVKLKLLLLKEEYQEALLFGESHKRELRNVRVDAVFLLCKRRLGLPIENDREEYSYLYKQYMDYSEEDFLNHIKKHFSGNDDEDASKVNSYFSPSFPINEIIDEVKKYIPSDKVLHTGYGDVSYYFRYDGCGRYNKKVENYFKVVCIQGTSNIITIHPIDYGEDLPHVNLNYMVPKEEHDDIKKDQVARFYKRFNRNPK